MSMEIIIGSVPLQDPEDFPQTIYGYAERYSGVDPFSSREGAPCDGADNLGLDHTYFI